MDGGDARRKRLLRTLLSWDYIQLCKSLDAGEGLHQDLRRVPTTFTSVKDYVATFQPLMLEECAALLMRGSQEGQDQPSHPAHLSSLTQKEDFTLIVLTVRPGVAATYNQNDMVLLSRDDPADWDAIAPEHTALGIFEARTGEQSMTVRFCLSLDTQSGNLAGSHRIEAVRKGLEAVQGSWFLLRLSNMSTIIREWEALHSVTQLAFKEAFLSGRPEAGRGQQSPQTRLHIPPAMHHALEQEYNASQMAAMCSGLSDEPVVLIQGPPGTGKTRTILGLLSIVLHASIHRVGQAVDQASDTRSRLAGKPAGGQQLMRLWGKACPWVAGRDPLRDAVKPWEEGRSQDCFGLASMPAPVRISSQQGTRARVLVCAPSNSALDELLRRIIQTGIRNRQGNRRMPSCVRVGLQPHHEVRHITLDAILEQRMAAAATAQGHRPGQSERELIKAQILDEAQIVCSTLSFAGSSLLLAMGSKFDSVVIDEAAQAVEPSTLIPLVSGCKQVFLVGDPIQLPATVISGKAEAAGYSISLFKRMQAAESRVQLLDTQYRMHPAIAGFPSEQFYGGQLRNAEGMAESTRRPWHEHACLGPVAVFDCDWGREVQGSNFSLQNLEEAALILQLYDALVRKYPELRDSSRIGIISPYKAQVNLLKSTMLKALGEKANEIDIQTIDGFQGREKEVILFSTVRTADNRRIGFVADERRINVGLTRAQSSLLVVGNASALGSDARWSSFMRMAQQSRCMYKPHEPVSAWMTDALAGKVQPVEPAAPASDDFVPMAEPGVEDDEDMEEAQPHEQPEMSPQSARGGRGRGRGRHKGRAGRSAGSRKRTR
ncbi:hypothetical protein WJX73_008588 [Symbiochloris irregularis]|uniref:Uncharacterized protein n=1 Tax=Symbiochloris irregularis TaxID=706552 RepID=A0AAW1PFI9_9CHLO